MTKVWIETSETEEIKDYEQETTKQEKSKKGDSG